jgi:hypothetical protein
MMIKNIEVSQKTDFEGWQPLRFESEFSKKTKKMVQFMIVNSLDYVTWKDGNNEYHAKTRKQNEI